MHNFFFNANKWALPKCEFPSRIFLWLIRCLFVGSMAWIEHCLICMESCLLCSQTERACLLACISKAFVLSGSMLSLAVSLEHLCPNFVIFLSSHCGHAALIAAMNKLHAATLFNWLEFSQIEIQPLTWTASPRRMNSWQSWLKGFFLCNSRSYWWRVPEANLAVHVFNMLILFLSTHAGWEDREWGFPIHSLWESSCTGIDSREGLQSIRN